MNSVSKRGVLIALVTAIVAVQLGLVPAALAGHTLATPTVSPQSPANNNNPVVSGTTTAANGASVNIYGAAGCGGGVLATTTVSSGAYSVTVPVTDNSTRTFYARVRDHSTNVCSASGVVYSEDSAAPSTVAYMSGSTTPNEGSTITYSYLVRDANVTGAGGIAMNGTSGNCGSGDKISDAFPGTSGSNFGTATFLCSWPDGPVSTSVSLRVTDRAGNSTTSTTTAVNVQNVAPTVAFTSGTTSPVTDHDYPYEYSIVDPGQDSITVATSCGTGSKSNPTNSDTSGSFDCLWTTAGSDSVTAQATDSDGAAGNTDTRSVTVTPNQGPTVSLAGSNDTSADEGPTSIEYAYSIDDPESDNTASVVTDCGNAGTKVTGSDEFDNDDGSFECTFPDGPDSSTVSVQATDSLGVSGNSDPQAVTIANVAPTVEFTTGPTTTATDHTYTYEYSISDPGQDSVLSVATSCGTATKSNPSNTDTSGRFDCTFSAAGIESITAQATDEDGDAGNTDSIPVIVAMNAGPTVDLASSNDTDVDEGASEILYEYTIDDSEGDDTQSVSTSCGTAGTKVAGSDEFDNDNGSFECTFPDGLDSSTVSVIATDSFGVAGNTDTQTVSIANVGPTLTFTSGPESVATEHTYTYEYSMSDVGQDPITSVTPSCGVGGTISNPSNDGDSGSFNCTWASSGTASVTAQATDSDGTAGDIGSVAVTIAANQGPVVTLSGSNPTAVGEASTERTYTYSVSDTEGDSVASVVTSCGTGGTKVSGSDTFNATSGRFRCIFAQGPASPTVSVQATDNFGDSGNTDTQPVTVENVAPAVELSGPSEADEGETKTYTYSVSDPGNDVASVIESCGSDGTYINTLAPASFDCTFPDGPASSNVSVTAEDADEGSGSDTVSVSVSNIAPDVTITGTGASAEGDTQTYTYTVSDPGDDSDPTVTEGCGSNGTYSADGVANSFDCTFPDGPATSDVSVSADDGAGVGTDTKTITITNVAPTIAISGPDDVVEGGTHTFTYTVTDPGDDADPGVTEECGNNGTYAADADPNSFSCTFIDGPRSSPVKVTVDDGAAIGSDTKTVTIANAAPTAVLSGPTDSDEGASKTYTYTVTDPGNEPDITITEGCGDNGTYAADADANSFSCTFPDGPASSDVSVSVDDGDDEGDDTVTVTVANVAPVVTLDGPALVAENARSTYTYTVVDSGTDTFSIDGGFPACGIGVVSGSGTQTESGGSYVCQFARVTKNTLTTTSIRVADEDGATSAAVDLSLVVTDAPSSGGGGGSSSRSPSSGSDPGDVEAPVVEGGADSDHISPNGDGRLDTVHISATLSEEANWSLTIETSTTGPADTGALSFVAANQIVFSKIGHGTSVAMEWDGTSYSGDPVADGVYQWTLTATDAEGNETTPLTGPIVIDRTSPVLAKLRINHLRHRGHRQRHTKIRFALNEPAAVAVKVRARGRLVRGFAPIHADPGQTVSLVWKCRNDAGRKVRDGRYRVILRAVDRAGNRTIRPVQIRVRS